MNFLKKLFKKSKTTLNPMYMNDIPSQINYKKVRQALQNESLSEVIGVFEFFKRFDTQISSELNKRKMQVTRLPLIVESKDKTQDIFLKDFVKSRDFRKLLFLCSTSISYGFSSFILQWEALDSKVYPKLDFISMRYFESDEAFMPYIEQAGNRIYLHEVNEDIYTIYHPSDAGNIIESSLMNKIISLASLKHITMQRYMSYLDSFSVPPLIIKSEATSTEETSKLILQSALNLRSNGVGLFAKDDVLEVLNGNVDKGTFLDFVRYCDECISKVITSQVLAGNSTQFGTQALGSVHEGITRNVLEFDAGLLAENITPLLTKMLEYNFARVAPFYFEIDTNTEKDEKLQAEVYNLLSNMGIQIPLKHLENTFKIEGLEYKQTQSFMQEPQDYGNTSQTHAIKDIVQNALTKNAQAQTNTHSYKDTMQKGSKEYKKLIKLPQTKLDKELDKIPIESDFNVEEFIKDCETFEEVSNKLYEAFSGEELLLREEELLAYMLQANLYGMQKGNKNG